MEFWGVEVKAGQKLKVHPGSDTILHLSQASLGEAKKAKKNESVPLFLKVDDQKLVIGTLSAKKCNHIMFDLVFEKEFELSHNWSNGSVYFCGYKSPYTEESDDDSSENESDSEEEEHTPHVFEENGIPEQKDVPSKEKVKEEDTDSDEDEDEEDSEDDSEDESAEQKNVPSKPSTDNAKSKVKVVEPIKEEKVKEEDTDSDDEEYEEDSEDEDKESAEEMADSSDDEDDEDEDDDSSDEEDEATPKKAEQNKKRPAPPAESDTKTPTGKKAKLVTPQKIGGEGKKTGGHIATPYPSKQAGKTSANKDKSKQQTPASDGQVNCGSCSKSFKSDQARDSHSKAKHGAAK